MHRIGTGFSGLTSNKMFGYCTVLILLGIVSALVAIILEDRFPHLPYGWALARRLLDHLAIALFSIGLVAIIIEFRDWREYFQQRIAETILQQAYLRTLDRDQLIAIQTNTLKAFFKVEDLDRKDSFLEFFHSRLHKYIASPYREDVDYQFAISEGEGEAGYWRVDEIASYKCRAVGTSIPDFVQWTSDPKPAVECDQVIFTIVFPRDVCEASDFKKKYPTAQESRLTFRSDEQPSKITPVLGPAGGCVGYRLPLDEYRDIDGLGIGIHSTYKMQKGLPLAWTMIHPTRRFSITISYPTGCRAIVHLFGFDDEHVDEQEENPGVYNLRYDSWLLPDSGVSIDLVARGIALPFAAATEPVS